jgi:hypothetical protein
VKLELSNGAIGLRMLEWSWGTARAQDGAEVLGYVPYIARRRTETRKAEIGRRILGVDDFGKEDSATAWGGRRP